MPDGRALPRPATSISRSTTSATHPRHAVGDEAIRAHAKARERQRRPADSLTPDVVVGSEVDARAEIEALVRHLIVTHGLTIRCFVMRFLHLSVEQFDSLANPHNGEVITLADRDSLDRPMFTSGRWGVEGLRLRDDGG